MAPTPRAVLEGGLLGLMVGDCLGLPREELSPGRARRVFGAEPRHAFLLGRGMASDDTEHACLTAQALLAESADPRRFARLLSWKLRFWLLGLPAGVGLATLRSGVKLWLGFGPENSGVRSAGNGGVVRAVVAGMFFEDEARARAFVDASTRITHVDERALRGCRAAARAAGYAARRGRASFAADDLLARLEELFPPEDAEGRRWLALVRRATAESWDGARFARELGCEKGVSGYIYQTLPAVLWAWLGAPFDFRAALSRVLALGGDADTTGAIAGALCGAAVGPAGIPTEWLDGVWEYPRSAAWVGRLAGRLEEKKAGREARPLALAWPALIPRNLLFLAVVLCHGFARPFLFLWTAWRPAR